MSSSPKSKRLPPPRKFEYYTLTYVVSSNVGLTPVSNDKMTYVPGNPGKQGIDDAGAIISIGFPFEIEGVTYTNVYVNTNGWAALIDPNTSQTSFSTSDVMTSTYGNHTISGQFTHSHVVLCPWFDDLRNTFYSLSDSDSGINSNITSYLTALGRSRTTVSNGTQTCPAGIEESSGGMKYYNGVSSDSGRYLVVRWKSFSFWSAPLNIISYEFVLYENGSIEFRYEPKVVSAKLSTSATVGIFMHGGSSLKPRYRDFGFELKRNGGSVSGTIDVRPQYQYGGAIYDGSYTDTDDTNASPNYAKYTSSLREDLHWPGQESFGAIFKFSPPQYRSKIKRNITMFRDSVPFLGGQHSEFDDQNVITFTTQSIEYPSMMPSQFIIDANYEASDGVARLFQSGSIRVTRAITPGLFDSVLSDSLIDAAKRSNR